MQNKQDNMYKIYNEYAINMQYFAYSAYYLHIYLHIQHK